ncbi:glycosyltransferase family 4 protein [Paenibacillus allorhizosphaerae]|uniref:D-inositol-3-phosphate glycosyltransferase n=1 Tax=Paenibacillus allorhizosphaerae TaxID=2849866 RepID=A0ABM8VFD4_9BACL|nr:glycosyltransferase family 4 protein [Paenibacillus allorhizosphaerae]CAG7632397.1 D-inositol-3-phosphate glycosyltransferase [Paenibacillus allorhizosphaerae]
MKILATGMGWIEHTPGGLNRYFADYLQAMRRHGHQVEGYITAFGERTTAPDYINDVVSEPGKIGTWARMKAFRQVIGGAVTRQRPDIFNPHFALYSSLITRNQLPSSLPIVTHFQGPWAQESLVEDKGHRIGQTLRYEMKKQVELLAYRRSDRFIVLSDYFKQLLSNDYGINQNRIHRIPAAPDLQRFRPAPDRRRLRQELGLGEEKQVMFCARRLVNRMGIDHLIQAMRQVTAQSPEAELYIAGGGTLREPLEQLVKQYGLGARVRFLGRVSNEDLVRWYQAADLSIVPTLTLEGFGLVTVEALACGTPVLGTPYGGTKEILEGLSPNLLFQDSSPEAMADKIGSVLRGEVAIPSRDACIDYVLQHYTWERAAKEITNVFEHAVAERKEVSLR